MWKEDNPVENEFISTLCTINSTLMNDDAGSGIQMQGHGEGRIEDKLKEVSHRRSRQALTLT